MQLLDFRPGQVRVVREITDTEHASYRSSARHLRDFGRWRAIVTMVSANRDEFAQSLAEAPAKLDSHQTLDEARRAIDFSLNRHLLNFLGAMRFFLDHTQTRLTRHYGDGSVPLMAFKARTAKAYDT